MNNINLKSDPFSYLCFPNIFKFYVFTIRFGIFYVRLLGYNINGKLAALIQNNSKII